VPHDVIETLVRFGSPILDVLIAQLSGGGIDTRRASAVALGRLGDRAAVPALIDSLSQADTQLLAPICGALGPLGDERAFEPLLAHMGHPTRRPPGGDRCAELDGHPQMAARISTPCATPTRSCASRRPRSPATSAIHPRDRVDCVRVRSGRAGASALEHVVYEDARVLPTLLQALGDTARCRAQLLPPGHIDHPSVEALHGVERR
jgi:hypothetical protein